MTWHGQLMYRKDNKKKDSVFFFLCTNDKHHRTTTSIFFSIALFRLREQMRVVKRASRLTGCDVKRRVSADRRQEVCRCDTIRTGYSTRSYKMYKTQSSNYKHHALGGGKSPMFQMVSNIWKTICASVCFAIFLPRHICASACRIEHRQTS